jgi:Asp-tRNA(Asn)/Glu-tRNA(Gln) amidotransferase A subunit family amidase
MTEPYELSASDAIKKIKNKSLSIHEWVLSCIERIKDKEPKVKAWAFLDEDNSLKKAKDFDDVIPNNKIGIPFGVKDIIDVANLPSGLGTKFYNQNIPIRDAGSIAIAKNAGCIVLGKTVTTELGHRAPGPTANPHNLEHTPGGSSSGSAAAVADMMVPICLGTQTTGSVIRPAAYCGVIGYKPTYGDFDKSGILPNSPSIDTLGIMSRSVEDISLFRSILLEEKNIILKNIDLKTIKIGFVRTPNWEDTDDETKNNLEDLFNNFQSDKINIIELNLDDIINASNKLHIDISGYEFKRSISFERFNHYDQLSEILKNGRLNDGYNVTNDLYRKALKELNILKNKMDLIFDDFDLIITPSAPGEALKGLDYTGSAIFNTAWSLIGNPCLTLPLFKGKNGLPIGCQLVTKVGNDNQLLSYSKQFHSLFI